MLALVIVVAGAGAFLFLPTATAVVTPARGDRRPGRRCASWPAPRRREPDPASLTVPARAHGPESKRATASRRPASASKRKKRRARSASEPRLHAAPTPSPRGASLARHPGSAFAPTRPSPCRPAELVGLTIVPSQATVAVTAVEAGPDGNVEPNAIRGAAWRGTFFLKVTNPEATTGGSRTEFPRVTQEDVDKATTALTDQLTAAFDDRLDDPDLPGDAATVFPETKALGEPTFSVDPAKLLGQEVEAFDLGATSTGTVIAVDTKPVQAVAEARIESSVTPGYTLVDGSGQVDPAPAEVADGVITFPVVVTARQRLRSTPIRSSARSWASRWPRRASILATYGDADLTVWPDWVGTVPTIDSRVEVTTPEPEPSATEPEASP